MTPSRFDRFLPLAGVLAGVAFLAVNILTWDAPNGTDVTTVTAWGSTHETRSEVAGFALALVAVLMAFFTAALRQAIRSGEPGESTYSSAAFAGGVMVASASGLWSFLSLAQASAVRAGDRAAVQTLAHLTSLAWLPWLMGAIVLFVALGLGGLRTAGLPSWLSWPTLVLGLLGLTGIGGFAVYLVMPVWLIVAGAVLTGQVGRDSVAAEVPRQPAHA